MTKNFKKVLAIVMAAVLLMCGMPFSIQALEGEGDYYDEVSGLYYDFFYDGTILITGYSDSISNDLIIPSAIGGRDVTEIGGGAFSDCLNLRSVSIPSTVKRIGVTAFFTCVNLKSVDIADGLTSIGMMAFTNCYGLTNINIPNSVKSIEDGAFTLCASLKNIDIPESVTSIGASVFNGCFNLTSVNISKNVTSIGKSAFGACGVSKITVDPLNEYYSSDDDGVLYNKDKTILLQYPVANQKESYRIPDSVTSIGRCAFTNMNDATLKPMLNGLVDSFASNEEYNQVVDYEELRQSINADSVPSMGCLRSLTIPKSVNKIDAGAVYTESLEKVVVCNPDCEIGALVSDDEFSSEETISPTEAIIYGRENSTAQQYAEKYDRTFKLIGEDGTCDHNYVGSVTEKATCVKQGTMTYTCSICGDSYTESIEIDSSNHTGETEIRDAKEATCTSEGYTGDTYCAGCHAKTATGNTIPKISHSDKNNDGYCDSCGTDLGTKKPSCSHLCHKTGFLGFIWKIINFFNKLFRSSQYCSCGVKHW